jgi:hypothetical protein
VFYLIEGCQRFGGTYYLHLQGLSHIWRKYLHPKHLGGGVIINILLSCDAPLFSCQISALRGKVLPPCRTC